MDHSVILHWVLILVIGTSFVAVFQWARLSPILGYLATGLVIGPAVLRVLEDGPSLRLLAELGVVLLMFTIGLEFSLTRFLSAKRLVLGVGGGQVVFTSLVLGGLIAWLGVPWVEALVIAAALSMSSTAIVLKQLGEQNELSTFHGRIIAGVLLFQDIAAVPILVCLPVLVAGESELTSLLSLALGKAVLVFFGLVVAGRHLLPPILSWVAKTRSLELFMLTALLMAVSAAAVSHLAGLSPTLGAFMAGMLLGETRFKHQIEADIRPFRDLMLGVFFLSIGMQLEPEIFISQPADVVLTLLALLIIKPMVLVPLVTLFKHRLMDGWRSAVTLAHGGEFGLLVVSSALALGVLNDIQAQSILAAIIASMLLAPLLMRSSESVSDFLSGRKVLNSGVSAEATIAEQSNDMQDHVVVCGYGRLGQNVSRILQAEAVEVLALDLDPERVQEASAAGEQVVFGNATHLGVLRALGLERAKAMAITISDTHVAKQIIELARSIGFERPILVRSHRGRDEECLGDIDVNIFPEGLETSLAFTGQLMIMLDIPASKVEAQLNSIRAEDYAILRRFFHASDFTQSQQQSDYPVLMRSIVIHEEHYAKGRTIHELGLDELGIELVDIRRGAIQVPGRLLDSRLREGDVVVLCGQPEALDVAIAQLTEGT